MVRSAFGDASRGGSAPKHLGLVRPPGFRPDDGALQNLVAEQRALQASGTDRDTEVLDHVAWVDLPELLEAQAAQLIGEDRRGRLADRAASSVEGNVGDALLLF